MFLTKECDYAMRVVRALSDMDKKPVKTICDYEHIPLNFAYKILKKLEHGGIVRSIRGPLGGYQLSKALSDISMFDIFAAVDEGLFINECLRQGHVCPRNAGGKSCSVHHELAKIQNDLIDTLKKKTMDMFL